MYKESFFKTYLKVRVYSKTFNKIQNNLPNFGK